MSYGKGKTEGGHKGGHSNTTRRVFHQEAKADARKQRRIEARGLAHAAMKDATLAENTRLLDRPKQEGKKKKP